MSLPVHFVRLCKVSMLNRQHSAHVSQVCFVCQYSEAWHVMLGKSALNHSHPIFQILETLGDYSIVSAVSM